MPFDDLERQTRPYEAMDYLIGHIHGLVFPRIFFPERFAPKAKDDMAIVEPVKAQGRTMAEEGFAILGRGLGGKPYVVGDRFTIADTPSFSPSAPTTEVRMPANIQAHFKRVKARPLVQKVTKAWGEA